MVNWLVETSFRLLDLVILLIRHVVRAVLHPWAFFRRSGRFVSIDNRPWSMDIGISLMFLAQRAKRRIEDVQRRGEDELPQIHWKGIQSLKDPFSAGAYPLLLWELRPASVIELGSYKGGSAVWMADMMECMGIEGHVYSFDIRPELVQASHPAVTFGEADMEDPSTLDREELASLPHPWLVIEDAHRNVYGVLKFFDQFMVPGDYFIVEDTSLFRKHAPLKKFLKESRDGYLVDTKYTDLYGYNVTWHTNGYLRKM